MITLLILLELWFFYSGFRIYKKVGWKDFNPFVGSFGEYFGFIFGAICNLIIIVAAIVIFLP